jgi:epoxide hydrolase-like predicted phosphatase
MPGPQRLEAALFDFGGVFTASPFAAAESVGAELGAAPGHLLSLVFGPDEDTDHPWHRLERGEIAFGEARDAIIALGREAGFDTDPIRVFQRLGLDAGIRPAFVERARRLRGAGVRTALVTNNAREFRDRWRPLLPLDELFELVIDSSEVGVRKPDPAIFRLTLDGLSVSDPARAVFLDDFEANVVAARALGLHGLLVGPDPGTALAELDALIAGL